MMKKILTVFILACLSCVVYAQDNVIDEIVWVVGDDAILRSDIESQRLYLQNEAMQNRQYNIPMHERRNCHTVHEGVHIL